MKKIYEKPTVELVVFNYADVIAASGDPLSTWMIDSDTGSAPTGTIPDTADWSAPDAVSDDSGSADGTGN